MARTVVDTLFLMLLSSVTGQLQIYQGRVVTTSIPLGVEVWRVEGVATVELGGVNPPTYYFDCNSTVNNGSGITWSRLGGAQIRFSVSELGNGKRMDARDFRYEDLGEYSCWDQRMNNELILNITDSNPAVCPVSSSVGITQGLSTTLEVYISGYPPVRSTNVHWYRLNPTRQEITSGATFHDSRRRMVLTDVQTSDAGMYLCEATIPLIGIIHLWASATIDLQVYVPSTIVDQPYNIRNMSVVAEWSNLTLCCSATGSPLPTIIWEREGGMPLPLGTRQTSVTNNSLVTSTLTFSELGVRYDDRGRYRCVASNPHTAPASSTYILISVTLVQSIWFPPVNFTYVVNETDPVMFMCSAIGTSPPEITWTRNEVPLDENVDPRISLSNPSGAEVFPTTGGNIYSISRNLTISNVRDNDSDTYTCVASNVTQEFEVIVQVPPQLLDPPDNLTVVEPEDATFSCLATGRPRPTIAWLRLSNLTLLQPSSGSFSIVEQEIGERERRSNLSIVGTDFSDAGAYGCVAMNEPGTTAKQATLIVHVVEQIYSTSVPVTTTALVSTWAQSGLSISVDSTRLDVDPSCPTQLESFEAGDCESETVTGQPATSGVNVAALSGAIGTVIVLLILVIAVLVVVILLQRTRKQKKFSPKNIDE